MLKICKQKLKNGMVLLIDGQKHSHQTCFHQENICPLKLMYTPLNPTFIFLTQNIHCGYSLELPRQGGSNMYAMYVLSADFKKNQNFSNESFQFLLLKTISVKYIA